MILLDTNVVSELMRPHPDRRVVQWFDDNFAIPLYVSSITEAELWAGFYSMPAGKRRTKIGSELERMFSEDFEGRILTFDRSAAQSYGKIYSARKRMGRPVTTADGQIAAIALTRGFKLATRNLSDFEQIDVVLIDPWAR